MAGDRAASPQGGYHHSVCYREAVLSELRPWLRKRPPIDQFQEQLEATVGTFWRSVALRFIYTPPTRRSGKFAGPRCRAKTALRKMEESSALEMSLTLNARSPQ